MENKNPSIGHIIDERGSLSGKVAGLGRNLAYSGLDIDFWLIQVENKKTDKSPDFRIMTNAHGAPLEIGCCFFKKDRQGGDYLSLMFTDKSLPNTIFGNAFPNEANDGGYQIAA